jgi:SAM-dependent methyltransferase
MKKEINKNLYCPIKLKNCVHEKIIELGKQPPANNLKINKSQFINEYDLNVFHCKKCNLLQHDANISPKKLYSNYNFLSSASRNIIINAKNFTNEINLKFKNIENILEIACNDGYLLDLFKKSKKNYFLFGVEPAKNISKILKKKKIKHLNSFFNIKNAKKIKNTYKKFDLIIMNNVFAHNRTLEEFIIGCDILLNQNGIICIETSNATNLIKKNLFDTIYHEHYYYYFPSTIKIIFEKYNFEVFNIKKINMQGGSFRYYIKRKENKIIKLNNNNLKKIYSNEIKINKESIGKFNKKMSRLRKIVENFFSLRSKKLIYGFGAAAKSTVFINYFGLNEKKIKYIIDDTQEKKNKFIPNTKIKILSSADIIKKKIPDFIIIFAWNYKVFITRKLKNFYRFCNKKIIIITFLPKFSSMKI